MRTSTLPFRIVVSRIAAGVLGGYLFVWGFTALTIVLAVAAGVPYGDAQILAYLLAFLVYLVALCWAFAARSLVRVWAVLAGTGLLMTATAWLLSRTQV